VPSAGERSGVFMLWWNMIGSGLGATLQINDGVPSFSSNSTASTAFRNAFLLPLGGLRGYNSTTSVTLQGYDGHGRTSSPSGTSARYLQMGPTAVIAAHPSSRAYGQTVRCFQN
jgi:hypothetical protein